MENEKNIVSVELNYDIARKLIDKIRTLDLWFDIAQCYNKTLIRVEANEDEKRMLNDYLDVLYKEA